AAVRSEQVTATGRRDHRRTSGRSRRRPRSWFLVTSRLTARPPLLSVSFGYRRARRMFGLFKKKPEPPPAGETGAHQPPGEGVPGAGGGQLTALEEAIVAVPAAILGDNETIGAVIHCDDGVRLNLPTAPHPTPDERILIWLQPGQSVWLSKSCQGVVMPQSE